MMKSLRERFVKFRRAFRCHLKQRCCTLLWTECPWPFIGPWWARRNFGQSNGHQWEISMSLAAGPKLISRAPWNLQPEVATLQQTNSCSYVGVKVGPQAQLHTACCKQFEKGWQTFCASTYLFVSALAWYRLLTVVGWCFKLGLSWLAQCRSHRSQTTQKGTWHAWKLKNWSIDKLKLPSTLGLLMFWVFITQSGVKVCRPLSTLEVCHSVPKDRAVSPFGWSLGRSAALLAGTVLSKFGQGTQCRVNYFTESIHIPVTQSSERLEAALGSYRMTLTRTSERLDRYKKDGFLFSQVRMSGGTAAAAQSKLWKKLPRRWTDHSTGRIGTAIQRFVQTSLAPLDQGSLKSQSSRHRIAWQFINHSEQCRQIVRTNPSCWDCLCRLYKLNWLRSHSQTMEISSIAHTK